MPVLIKNLGRNKKVAFLTPDYTYGHTVRQSVEKAMKEGEWTAVTNQLSPLGTTDFSSYLLNVANSGADVVVNINFGRDAVLSIKQAKDFGILNNMTLAIPYNTPFLAKDVGAGTMQGVFAATDYWWTLEDKFPLAKLFNEAFKAKYNYYPEWQPTPATCSLPCGPMPSSVRTRSIRRILSRPMKRATWSSLPLVRFTSEPRITSWCALSLSPGARSQAR